MLRLAEKVAKKKDSDDKAKTKKKKSFASALASLGKASESSAPDTSGYKSASRDAASAALSRRRKAKVYR